MNTPDVYRALAAEGLTMAEAAEQLGLTRQAVETAARRHGIRFISAGARTVARIRGQATLGITAPEAARNLGLGAHYVRKLAKAHGIAFRPCANARALGADLPPDVLAEYRWLRKRKAVPAAEALAMVGARA